MALRVKNVIGKPAVSPTKAVRQRWISRPSWLLVRIASLMLPIEEHNPWLSSKLFGAGVRNLPTTRRHWSDQLQRWS